MTTSSRENEYFRVNIKRLFFFGGLIALLCLVTAMIPVRAYATCPTVHNTLNFTIVYGNLTLSGMPAPVGTVVVAKSPRGDVVGCSQVTTAGSYGAMYIYGEDNSINPPIPGMRTGEQVTLILGDYVASPTPVFVWSADRELHQVDLTSTSTQSALANFSANPVSGPSPLTVQFTNLSNGTISGYQWDFGDGSAINTQANPSHTYTAPGFYSVKLTVSGAGGVDYLRRTDFIAVTATQPVADFSATPVTGVSPLSVAFTNHSTNATSYLWDFGDGETSTEVNPTHIYLNNSGSSLARTVRLTAYNTNGSHTVERTAFVTVYSPVAADFSATPTSGTAPLVVSFTNLSSGNWTISIWDFGDGSAGSNEINPTHTYTTAGVYTVSLTVSGPGGTRTRTQTGYITVASRPPHADFNGSPLAGNAPLSVAFTNLSTDATMSLWSFGDSTSSNQTNPVHVYADPGRYTVTLAVSGPGGSDLLTRSEYISVYAPVHAGFTADKTSGGAPLTVQFTNQSSGDFTLSAWEFGDGLISTDVNPIHTYTSAGIYSVKLTVSGPGGSDSVNQADLIVVAGPSPVADFSATPVSGTAPLTVQFTNLSQHATAYLWDFGDGTSTSSEANPTHIYSTAGRFTVKLTASSGNLAVSKEMGGYIQVSQPPPTAGFSVSTTSGIAPLEISFTNQSTCAETFLWDFGDGSAPVSEESPRHTYAAGGRYTVTLTVSNSTGSDHFSMVIIVYTPVKALFEVDQLVGNIPLRVKMTNLSSGDYTSVTWDFGDGQISHELNPTHLYVTTGTFTITLLVEGPGGSDFYVLPSPIVAMRNIHYLPFLR